MKETPKKLFTAYVGESQARNRYTFWAKIAKKEGYALVSKIFLETRAYPSFLAILAQKVYRFRA
jgi:rubrerythrin